MVPSTAGLVTFVTKQKSYVLQLLEIPKKEFQIGIDKGVSHTNFSSLDQKILKATFEIVKRIDKIISEELGEAVCRRMLCKNCQLDCKKDEDEGEFLLKADMELKQPRNPCSNFKQSQGLSKDITTLIQRAKARKPFQLHSLMTQNAETLGLETFKDSNIKRQLETGSLKIGEQIWIYHDTGCHNLRCGGIISLKRTCKVDV